MTDFVKNLITERIVLKIVGFVFAIGVLPILIFLYGLDNAPKWIEEDKHYLEKSYALTIQAPLQLFNIQKSKKELKDNARIEFTKQIYDMALKQIKVSYDWSNLDNETKDITLKVLNSQFLSMKIDFFTEQSTYEDKLDFTIYGLYTMEKADIDVLLQGVYEKVNQKVLESL